MNRHIACVAALIACGAAQGTAHADTPFAYDGFNYDAGSTLAGQTGGSGWAGPWGSNAPAPASVVSGLSYSDSAGQVLPVQGGAVMTSPSVFFAQETRDTTEVFGQAGTSVWMSFLVQQASSTGGISYAQAALGQGLTFGSSAMSGGLSGSGASVGGFYATSGVAATTTVAPGSVTFIVLRFDFASSGGDTISLWVNPLLGDVAGVPDASGSFRDYAPAFSGMTFAYGDNRSFIFDELRIGSSYAAVASAVPEPRAAAMMLAGLCAAGAIARRRRHHEA